jgi:hypothetical protein
MGTGIVSIDLSLDGHETLSRIVLVVTVAVWVALGALLVARVAAVARRRRGFPPTRRMSERGEPPSRIARRPMNAEPNLSPPHVGPLLGAYVLGVLDRRDVRVVERHLRGCPVCRAERERLAALPRLLDSAAATVRAEPPACGRPGARDG